MPKERHLQYIHFVKPKSDTELRANFSKAGTSGSYERHQGTASDGKNIKKFYCDLLSDTCSVTPPKTYTPTKLSQSQVNSEKTNTTQTTRSVTRKTLYRYFKAIEEGNVKDIARHLDDGVDINTVDEHGWTALMCASCSGHLSVVRLLVKKNCNVDTVNKKGQTALDIALEAKQSKIVKCLQGEAPQNINPPCQKINVTSDGFYCDVCKREVKDCSKRKHNTSTVHLFNLKIIPKEQDYILPESNTGFQLMLKGGWDQDKGLGSSGQGRKHPVKTVLKRDRLGLGSKAQTQAKVTHFGPKDKTAVKAPSGRRCMKPSTLSKRKQSKLQQKEKAKEKAFRREFY